jgi:dTDP-4-dehydrorhamnose 3,5-epimerase
MTSPSLRDVGLLSGVAFGRLISHIDGRGAFREIWRSSADRPDHAGTDRTAFVQLNLSSSRAGVLRGLHFHEHQLDRWVVLDGEVFVALVDLRETDAPVLTRVMRIDDTVTIPSLVAHGFLALKPTTLLYQVTNEYDGSDEHGIAWNDSTIAIPWPRSATRDGMPIVSDRDARNPSWEVVRRRLLRREPE